MTAPEQCNSLEEVRTCMDAIDRDIVSLIAKRVAYVKNAARFKNSAAAVADPDRMAKVLRTRREWAEAEGLDGQTMERLYRDLVAYCVAEEHKHFEKLGK